MKKRVTTPRPGSPRSNPGTNPVGGQSATAPTRPAFRVNRELHTTAANAARPSPVNFGIKPVGGTGNGPARVPTRRNPGGSHGTLYPLRPVAPNPTTLNETNRRTTAASARNREICTLILAAGLGKRMRSRASKLVHPVAGRPMVRYVVNSSQAAGASRTVVIIGNQADDVRHAVGDGDKSIAFAYQREQHGTGHAVLTAEKLLHGHQGSVLILNGDLPALRPETLRSFLEFHHDSGAPLSLLTTVVDDPTGYGRVIRNYAGDLSRIVEEVDATPDDRATQEINCGIYCVDIQYLFRPLKRATRDNAQGEIYLTDLVEILRREGRKVAAFRHLDPTEVLGVNDRRELAAASRALFRRKAETLMESGVTLIDPDTTYIDADVRVGHDTLLEPGVLLIGETTIGEGVQIGTGCRISDSSVGDGTVILSYSVINGAQIGKTCRVGPFAHMRPETTLDEEAHVGNFVETKKTRIGRRSKVNHLTYLGDTEVGRGANIGAGTITCNYDGVSKHRTVIEDEVFIGSDTQLVAPVRIRRGAFIGAGSTITRDVPPHALALSRTRQEVKEDWARRFGPRAQKGEEPRRRR